MAAPIYIPKESIRGFPFYGVLSYIKALSHFEFIFVYGVRVYSNFIDLPVAVQLFQNHLLKRLELGC